MYIVIYMSLKFINDVVLFFFFKQKTAYEMRISDGSSDVCSSDLIPPAADQFDHLGLAAEGIRIDRAFMLTEETDDRRDVGRDRRVDAEQIGDRKVPAILAVPPGQKEVCDPA